MKAKAEINKLFLDTIKSASNAAVQACYAAYCRNDSGKYYDKFYIKFLDRYKEVYKEHVKQPGKCEYTDHGPTCTPEKGTTCPIFALLGNFDRMSVRIFPPIVSDDISQDYTNDARMTDGRLINGYCKSRYVFMRSVMVFGLLATVYHGDFLIPTMLNLTMLGVTMATGIATIASGTTYACNAYQIHSRINGVCADLKEVYM